MKEKYLIVGLGLIGGSYADALTSKGYEVGAITKRESSALREQMKLSTERRSYFDKK
jgi:prephenate dehydrogenase